MMTVPNKPTRIAGLCTAEEGEDGVHLLAFIRGEDKYLFWFRKDQLADLRRVLVRFGMDERLNLTLQDTGEISKLSLEIAG